MADRKTDLDVDVTWRCRFCQKDDVTRLSPAPGGGPSRYIAEAYLRPPRGWTLLLGSMPVCDDHRVLVLGAGATRRIAEAAAAAIGSWPTDAIEVEAIERAIEKAMGLES